MANRTIDALPDLDPSLDVRLKRKDFEPGDVYIAARANRRTVKTKMDGDLFLPLVDIIPNGEAGSEDSDGNVVKGKGKPDPSFEGATLKLINGQRRWRKPLVVWSTISGRVVGTSNGNEKILVFPEGQDLRDYSEISTVRSEGSGNYIDPWMPLDFLIDRLSTEHDNFPVTGTRVVGSLSNQGISAENANKRVYAITSNVVAILVK